MELIDSYRERITKITEETKRDFDTFKGKPSDNHTEHSKAANEFVHAAEDRLKQVTEIENSFNEAVANYEKSIGDVRSEIKVAQDSINETITEVRSSVRVIIADVISNMGVALSKEMRDSIIKVILEKEKTNTSMSKITTAPLTPATNSDTPKSTTSNKPRWGDDDYVENGGSWVDVVTKKTTTTSMTARPPSYASAAGGKSMGIIPSPNPATERIRVTNGVSYKAVVVSEFSEARKYPGRICYNKQLAEACYYSEATGLLHGNLPHTLPRNATQPRATVLCASRDCTDEEPHAKCTWAHNSAHTKQQEEFFYAFHGSKQPLPSVDLIPDILDEIKEDRAKRFSNRHTTASLYSAGYYTMGAIIWSACLKELYGETFEDKIGE
jgi:hypothetical protein